MKHIVRSKGIPGNRITVVLLSPSQSLNPVYHRSYTGGCYQAWKVRWDFARCYVCIHRLSATLSQARKENSLTN